MPNTAPEFLHRAASIMEERGKQYDKPSGERSMGKTVQAFNAITGYNITEASGWLLLQLLKDARQWQSTGFHQDSADDCIAYAALKAEALAKQLTKPAADESRDVKVMKATAAFLADALNADPHYNWQKMHVELSDFHIHAIAEKLAKENPHV
jgi:hypothetical protein